MRGESVYGEDEVPMYAVKGVEILVVSFLMSALDRQVTCSSCLIAEERSYV
jgi:hypothetical protein